MKKASVLAVVLVPVLVALANADILWDNNVRTNGVNARALSPPAWPNIRVVDDFIVPEGERWDIRDMHSDIMEDTTWRAGEVVEIYLYSDAGNRPGTFLLDRSGPFERMATGDTYFGRANYSYWMEEFSPIVLGPGRYWIGHRNPDGAGSGTNYWMYSDGGPDGMNTSLSYFSLNGGETWTLGQSNHAFILTGVPEPSGAILLGLGVAVTVFRRR